MRYAEITVAELEDNGAASIQTGPFGTQLKASDYTDEGVPVINVRNIGYGDLRSEKLEFVPEGTAERLSVHILRESDIVFGRKGAVDRHLFVSVNQHGWAQGSDCIRLRLSKGPINPRFASYAFLRPYHKEWMLRQCGNKATMASLNQDVIRRIVLPFPQPEVQVEIVSFLSDYDNLIENNRRRIALLEEAARLLYREWFVHFRFPGHEYVKITDGLPEGWERRSVSSLADVFRGKSYRSSELVESDGQPFINLKCIERFGGFRISGLKWFRGEHKEHHLVVPGDVVIAVTDMTRDAMIVAQAARVPRTVGENAIYSMDLVKAVPRKGFQPEWFYGMLRFSKFSAAVREEATGATVLHLKPKHIEKWETVVPPTVLRDLFSEQFGAILKQADNLELQNLNCAQARDLLLPRLMNGEIAV